MTTSGERINAAFVTLMRQERERQLAPLRAEVRAAFSKSNGSTVANGRGPKVPAARPKPRERPPLDGSAWSWPPADPITHEPMGKAMPLGVWSDPAMARRARRERAAAQARHPSARKVEQPGSEWEP